MLSRTALAAAVVVLFSCARGPISGTGLATLGYYSAPQTIIDTLEAGDKGYHEHFLLGLAYKKEKKYKNAIFHFANSAFTRHRDPRLRLFPQPVYQFLKGFHIKSPYYGDAVYEIARLFSQYGEHPHVVKIIDLMPRDATALYRDAILLRAQALAANGDMDEARTSLESLLDRYDNDDSRALIHLRIGTLLDRKGDYAGALESLVKVFSFGADTWQSAAAARHLAGVLRHQTRKLSPAEELLFARSLHHAGMYDNALPVLEKRAAGGDDVAREYMVRSLARIGKANAAALVGGAAADAKSRTMLVKALADELWDMNKKSQALPLYQKVIMSGIEPYARDALKRTARRLEELKQAGYEKYITDYKDRYSDDDAGHLLWLLGRNMLRANNTERAIQCLEESVSKYPRGTHSDECRFWLHRLYSDSGDSARARAIARDMASINPDSAYTWRLLSGIAAARSEAELDDGYRAALAAGERDESLLYHALLFLKQKSMKKRTERLGDCNVPEKNLYRDLARDVLRLDISSGHGAILKGVEKYFIVGHSAGISRELKLLPKTAEARRDRNIALACYGNRYRFAFHQVYSTLELLKLAGLKENIFIMPEELAVMLFPRPFEECVSRTAAEYSLDRNVIYSLIKAESLFRHNAVSGAGAIGLMQLMPPTARGIARSLRVATYDLTDPCTSIRFGASYMAGLMRQFGGSFPYAVAAYNAGPGNVNKWKDRMRDNDMDRFTEFTPFIETRYYILRTGKFLAQYGAIYGER